MELADGVYALELTMERDDGTAAFHPTAVETPKGLLLVDAGLPGQTDQLADALADHGLDLAGVWAVVLTHHDGDHAGGLAAVCERAADPVVYAHEAAVPYVDGREFPVKSDPDGDRYEPVPVDVELRDGVTFRTDAGPMRAVFTPGHLAFHLPESGVLLAADALRSDDGDLVGPAEQFTPDMAEATRSVARLAAVDGEVETVHCYHGGTADAGTTEIAEVYESLDAEHSE
ncbi:MBL fold metallo-hydrolase [Halobaculum gomorrense]|uniref:Glyoxylase, beta-lactamase superfamily II n=1 Tax=Halobaculum gomorrense TaxID=43928 RepID=A0A1M5V3L2_9EURY|nr:MBL fold metallo-hydrolase [Halobaculum gomorrense]SHH69684.1 Glyoxylase, beta-lactamase superfamily II [Halobaculum gomorrense]